MPSMEGVLKQDVPEKPKNPWKSMVNIREKYNMFEQIRKYVRSNRKIDLFLTA